MAKIGPVKLGARPDIKLGFARFACSDRHSKLTANLTTIKSENTHNMNPSQHFNRTDWELLGEGRTTTGATLTQELVGAFRVNDRVGLERGEQRPNE